MSPRSDDPYLLRRRPPSERLVDQGFQQLAITLASVVAVVLLSILLLVFWGALESLGRYGLSFLTTSNWNPVDDEYGAGAATALREIVFRFLSDGRCSDYHHLPPLDVEAEHCSAERCA